VLRELRVKNFAIIDELQLRFEPGFNVLTGETGAGKSILIDAISLLLGGRADISMVRAGMSRALLEGLFILGSVQRAKVKPILEREGLENEQSDALWLSRELRRSGRSVARVNGSMVTLSLMREIAEGLVDIHGQSEHLSLLRVKEHLHLIDRFAGLDALCAKVSASARELQAVHRELSALRQGERERMQRIDLLRFQVQEIEAATLRPGEKHVLEKDLNRLSNAERLSAQTSNLVAILEENSRESPAILDSVGKAQREMDALARVDPSLASQAETLESIGYQLEDLAGVLRDYLMQVEFNPKRLAQVEERLSLLRHLERKYGRGLDEVLAYAHQARTELETLEHSDERIEQLEVEETTLLQETGKLCLELSQKRRAAALDLATGVEHELDDLLMQGARFGVAFSWQQDKTGVPLSDTLPAEIWVTSTGEETQAGAPITQATFNTTGIDRVEFLVAPNVGEGLKPMARIASGGETARLMLALKTVLSKADHTATLIFDEIDQGIGGRVGAVVGAKLWQLTTPGESPDDVQHQVLCITHLPQLASFGDTHYRVEKEIVEERTVTHVIPLKREARLTELAKMLGTQGDSALQGAQELVAQAKTLKQPLAASR